MKLSQSVIAAYAGVAAWPPETGIHSPRASWTRKTSSPVTGSTLARTLFPRITNGGNGTGAGGGFYQEGALYSLTPPANPTGAWIYKTLYSFNGPVTPSNGHGHIPYGVIVLKGTVLYGQNVSGGHVTVGGICNRGCGTVFMFGL